MAGGRWRGGGEAWRAARRTAARRGRWSDGGPAAAASRPAAKLDRRRPERARAFLGGIFGTKQECGAFLQDVAHNRARFNGIVLVSPHPSGTWASATFVGPGANRAAHATLGMHQNKPVKQPRRLWCD